MSDSADLGFLAGHVLDAAPRLLGATLRVGEVAIRLTEVEAYAGAEDPGSHAFRGRTRRNSSMFGPAGRLYVYFIYGMHDNANVVCGPEGSAAGILMRAGEVVEGQHVAEQRRPGSSPRDLARGPARLCKALGITRADDGADLRSGRVRLEPGDPVPSARVATGPRVGLRQAADRPWRFWIEGEPTVSTYRPAAPLRPRKPR